MTSMCERCGTDVQLFGIEPFVDTLFGRPPRSGMVRRWYEVDSSSDPGDVTIEIHAHTPERCSDARSKIVGSESYGAS